MYNRGLLIGGFMADSLIAADQEEKEKATALKFFTLLSPEKLKDARSLFALNCRHHNPYLPAGMDALLEGIKQAQHRDDMPKDGVFSIKHILADKDFVAVHTTLQSQSNKSIGLRQIHLFRFEEDKIAEYWDITQMAPSDAPNSSNMF
jgi:predicted SnoaL-like aldol condensation-catalyzing enzyme